MDLGAAVDGTQCKVFSHKGKPQCQSAYNKEHYQSSRKQRRLMPADPTGGVARPRVGMAPSHR